MRRACSPLIVRRRDRILHGSQSPAIGEMGCSLTPCPSPLPFAKGCEAPAGCSRRGTCRSSFWAASIPWVAVPVLVTAGRSLRAEMSPMSGPLRSSTRLYLARTWLVFDLRPRRRGRHISSQAARRRTRRRRQRPQLRAAMRWRAKASATSPSSRSFPPPAGSRRITVDRRLATFVEGLADSVAHDAAQPPDSSSTGISSPHGRTLEPHRAHRGRSPVVEIGTANGYSTVWLACGAEPTGSS